MKAATVLLKQESARSEIYRRLADAFRAPSPDGPEGLAEMAAALAQMASGAAPGAARLAAGEFNEARRHELQIDHAALFMGPFLVPAPPNGSVYLEDKRQLMGTSTVDVQAHYRRLGLDLAPDFKDAPDHICAELEFMHVLVCQAMAAIAAEDHGALLESVRHQQAFLAKHLAAWAPAFADRVIEHARSDYYRHLAAVLRTFVTEDLAALPDLPALPAEPLAAPARAPELTPDHRPDTIGSQ